MNKFTLLVADDDEMNRRVVSKFLSNEYEVLEASDGTEALSVIQNQKIDVALLDIVMPKMNGLEVIDWIKGSKAYYNIGILVATSTKERTEREALERGADDIVGKPYDPIVIKARLKNILAKKKLESALRENVEVKSRISIDRRTQVNVEKFEKINHLAQLISQNVDNKKLVLEFASQIQKNATIDFKKD